MLLSNHSCLSPWYRVKEWSALKARKRESERCVLVLSSNSVRTVLAFNSVDHGAKLADGVAVLFLWALVADRYILMLHYQRQKLRACL